jgi:hypothetical protein
MMTLSDPRSKQLLFSWGCLRREQAQVDENWVDRLCWNSRRGNLFGLTRFWAL